MSTSRTRSKTKGIPVEYVGESFDPTEKSKIGRKRKAADIKAEPLPDEEHRDKVAKGSPTLQNEYSTNILDIPHVMHKIFSLTSNTPQFLGFLAKINHQFRDLAYSHPMWGDICKKTGLQVRGSKSPRMIVVKNISTICSQCHVKFRKGEIHSCVQLNLKLNLCKQHCLPQAWKTYFHQERHLRKPQVDLKDIPIEHLRFHDGDPIMAKSHVTADYGIPKFALDDEYLPVMLLDNPHGKNFRAMQAFRMHHLEILRDFFFGSKQHLAEVKQVKQTHRQQHAEQKRIAKDRRHDRIVEEFQKRGLEWPSEKDHYEPVLQEYIDAGHGNLVDLVDQYHEQLQLLRELKG